MTKDYAEKLASFLPDSAQISEFASQPGSARMFEAFRRMTTWFGVLHELNREEESSVLLAAAHSKVIEIWILIPMGLLHSSYTSLRTFVDICTSYTFYHSHPAEWSAVCEDRADWESRSRIVEWHLRYNQCFRSINQGFSLADKLRDDYRVLSSYVHAVPVTGIPKLKGIEKQDISEEDLEEFNRIANFTCDNLNLMFLSVFHRDIALLAANDLKIMLKGINRTKLRAAGMIIPRV